MIHFLYPAMLCLALLPWLMLCLPPLRILSSSVLRLPCIKRFEALPDLSKTSQAWVTKPYGWLIYLAWLALIVAGMHPVKLGKPYPLMQKGRDIMMVVDISASMQMPDQIFKGQAYTRLSVVKALGSRFIDQRQGDRLGLIAFGRQPFLLTPLTFDHKIVDELLQDSSVGLAGKQTAIGDALGLGIKHLIQIPKRGKQVMILLTDGANNAGQLLPTKAAQLALSQGIKLYIIGFAFQSLSADRALKQAYDELTNMASITGGQFFMAQDANSLELVYKKLNQIMPIARDAWLYRQSESLVFWPILLAALILMGLGLCHVLLSERSSG